jgi:hypothetical protein
LRVSAVAGGAGSCANMWLALPLAGLRPVARSTCHAAPRHWEPARCATCNGLTPSLRPYCPVSSGSSRGHGTYARAGADSFQCAA